MNCSHKAIRKANRNRKQAAKAKRHRIEKAAPILLEACELLMIEMASRFDYETPTIEEETALLKCKQAIDMARKEG